MKLKKIKIYADLSVTFAIIGVMTFGGGYAMLPMLEREVVNKKKWATSEELADYYAIGQCTPGVIAVNTATFIGQKIAGIPGGLFATLGVVFPSVIIIEIIAAFLSNFADNAYIGYAFAGIRICVAGLVASSVIRIGKTTVKNAVGAVIFVSVLLLSLFLNISPAILVVCASLMGIAVFSRVYKHKKEDKEETEEEQ